jgi:hypothetical protein
MCGNDFIGPLHRGLKTNLLLILFRTKLVQSAESGDQRGNHLDSDGTIFDLCRMFPDKIKKSRIFKAK